MQDGCEDGTGERTFGRNSWFLNVDFGLWGILVDRGEEFIAVCRLDYDISVILYLMTESNNHIISAKTKSSGAGHFFPCDFLLLPEFVYAKTSCI